MGPARRSTRLGGARTKYTDDPFELAGVSDESDSMEASRAKKKGKRVLQTGDSSDDEFVDAGDQEEEPDFQSDDDSAEDGDEEGPFLSGMDDGSMEDDEKEGILRSRYNKRRRPDGTVALSGNETHARGIWNPVEHVAKPVHLRVTFGTDERDLVSIVYSRDRWFRGVDSAFPTMFSLNEAERLPLHSYGPIFGVDQEEMERESTRGWDWYYDDKVSGRSRKRQRLTKILEKEARRRYIPQPKKKKHTIIIGPVQNQKTYKLGQDECLNFGDAFGERQIRMEKGTKSSGAQADDETDDSSRRTRKTREGWILNLGNKVQCMAWAPNQSGLTQYLAVVAPISQDQKKQHASTSEPKAAPAFTPSAPYPTALQIWAFKAKKDDSLTKTLDMDSEPRLRLTLCTDWGDLRRISWCPMARAPRKEDDEDPMTNLGLLAGVWSDGSVRVLDIKISKDPHATEFYKVESPFFMAKPPSTVCSCVTWLSPSDIAVGCANGFVAIWSIAHSHESASDPSPYVYRQYHSTYILNLASAYPTHPHLLGTTSMDGETRLTSILDHQVDTVETTRMRIGSAHISYSPFLQSFFSSDENDFARILAVRRYFTTSAVARLPSTISALAPCSFWHPSALLGCTGGTVMATNPLRRLLYAKEKQWQQTWFTHEWAQGPEVGSSGVSRFQDGFRAESISLLRNTMGDRKLINGTMIITIYEEGTHITALAWNPNQSCAGWASAAMGCGLIRVEDLAI